MRRIAAISTVIWKGKASHAPTIVGKYLFGFNEDGQRPGLVPRSSRSRRTGHLTTISAAIWVAAPACPGERGPGGLTGTPAVVVIDRDGVVRLSFVGAP